MSDRVINNHKVCPLPLVWIGKILDRQIDIRPRGCSDIAIDRARIGTAPNPAHVVPGLKACDIGIVAVMDGLACQVGGGLVIAHHVVNIDGTNCDSGCRAGAQRNRSRSGQHGCRDLADALRINGDVTTGQEGAARALRTRLPAHRVERHRAAAGKAHFVAIASHRNRHGSRQALRINGRCAAGGDLDVASGCQIRRTGLRQHLRGDLIARESRRNADSDRTAIAGGHRHAGGRDPGADARHVIRRDRDLAPRRAHRIAVDNHRRRCCRRPVHCDDRAHRYGRGLLHETHTGGHGGIGDRCLDHSRVVRIDADAICCGNGGPPDCGNPGRGVRGGDHGAHECIGKVEKQVLAVDPNRIERNRCPDGHVCPTAAFGNGCGVEVCVHLGGVLGPHRDRAILGRHLHHRTRAPAKGQLGGVFIGGIGISSGQIRIADRGIGRGGNVVGGNVGVHRNHLRRRRKKRSAIRCDRAGVQRIHQRVLYRRDPDKPVHNIHIGATERGLRARPHIIHGDQHPHRRGIRGTDIEVDPARNKAFDIGQNHQLPCRGIGEVYGGQVDRLIGVSPFVNIAVALLRCGHVRAGKHLLPLQKQVLSREGRIGEIRHQRLERAGDNAEAAIIGHGRCHDHRIVGIQRRVVRRLDHHSLARIQIIDRCQPAGFFCPACGES